MTGRCEAVEIATAVPSPYYLRIDGSTLYVGTNDSGVFRMGVDGSAKTQIFTQPGRARSVAFDATHVFVASEAGVFKLPKANPSVSERLSATPAMEVAYADGAVYACDAAEDAPLLRYTLAGAVTVATLATKGLCESIAVRGQDVFFGGSSVYRVGIEGGEAIKRDSSDARRIAIDDTFVYAAWKSRPTIRRALLAGPDGDAKDIVTSPIAIDDGDIAVDKSRIYWTAGDANGGVFRAPKVGGPAEPIATGMAEPTGIAVDANAIYWTERGRGVVWRIAKPL